jgi:UPF0755 protein
VVERPTGVATPSRSRRPPPTRRQLVARRSVAFVLLAGLIAGAVWLGTIAVGELGSDAAPPPPPTTAAAAPPPKPLRIVFPEGFTRRQMAERIGAVNEIAKRRRKVTPRLSPSTYLRLTGMHPFPAGFAGGKKHGSLEGFLFPATYEFTAKTTTRQLVDQQLEAFERNWNKVDLRYARSKNLTPYDVLVIASMIEKETVVPKERRLVAAVIYNRLKAGMALGIDATIRYGLNIPPTEAIRESQLESSSPYNTRLLPGLPPTPIANPGLASIQAAAHPKRVDYLFFVRKADCRSHFFTASQQAFDAYPRAGLRC